MEEFYLRYDTNFIDQSIEFGTIHSNRVAVKEVMNVTCDEREKMYEERRKSFSEKYKAAFGVEPEFKKKCDCDGCRDEDTVIVFNYYGVKSNWL